MLRIRRHHDKHADPNRQSVDQRRRENGRMRYQRTKKAAQQPHDMPPDDVSRLGRQTLGHRENDESRRPYGRDDDGMLHAQKINHNENRTRRQQTLNGVVFPVSSKFPTDLKRENLRFQSLPPLFFMSSLKKIPSSTSPKFKKSI
jgi:hypothetical protein